MLDTMDVCTLLGNDTITYVRNGPRASHAKPRAIASFPFFFASLLLYLLLALALCLAILVTLLALLFLWGFLCLQVPFRRCWGKCQNAVVIG